MDETTTDQTKLDMQRVSRWAELLDGDAEAKQFMAQRLAGGELAELARLKSEHSRLAAAHKHGIPPELAEVHLTAGDADGLEKQAASLAELLDRTSGTRALARDGAIERHSTGEGARATETARLPYYDPAPGSREEWLEQQFRRLYSA